MEQGSLEQWLVRPGPVVEERRLARLQRMAARPPAPAPAAQQLQDMDVDDAMPPPAPLASAPATTPQSEPKQPPPGRPETRSRKVPLVPAEVDPSFPSSLLTLPPAPASDVAPPGLPDHTLGVLPPAWAPIIARDTAEAVTRQGPYSQAYLAGQPSKRRKLNTEKKPRGDVGSLISRSLQVKLSGFWFCKVSFDTQP